MLKKTLILMLFTAITAPLTAQVQDKGTTDMWDFVTSFTCTTGRQHGVVSDGEYIYTSAWGKSSTVLSMFYKYDMDGNFIEEFDVPGVTNSDNYMRDMTYDGQYFYGCDAHSGNIWCYDLHNKTLVGQIATSFEELGTCSYDPVYDAFWVGERASGSSPNLLLDLKLIDRNGNVIKTASPYNLGGHTVHGTGYFTDEDGVAHLYLFAVAGFTAHVFDYEIEADNMTSNYIFDFSVTPGWSVAASAGGAFIGERNGSICFFGDADQSPNLIGIYALGEYIPEPPTPPIGDIFYDFEDGILRWTTIDADGDGNNWGIRPIYGNPQNSHCVTSASVNPIGEDPLHPDNYLVSPFKLDYGEITFKACVQDASFPEEHIGVAVSTTGNTDPADFTTIWETTMTAKEVGDWYWISVDLRAYEGQEIWVAFRHFDCTNQFYVNIDDVTLYREYNSASENAETMLRTYPNPASDRLMVESPVDIDSYEIYNVVGALVSHREVASKSFEVNISEFSSGIYFIKTISEGMVQTKRFVKE